MLDSKKNLKSRFLKNPGFLAKKSLCVAFGIRQDKDTNKYSKYLRYPPIVEKKIKSIEDAKELAKAYNDLELTNVDCAMDLLEIAQNDERKLFILKTRISIKM